MARNHVRGYLRTGRYEVVALADLSEEAMAGYDAEFDLSTAHYTDGREMLDAGSAATWTGWPVSTDSRRARQCAQS